MMNELQNVDINEPIFAIKFPILWQKSERFFPKLAKRKSVRQ